jgi:signal transduction histidine kinase
MNKRGGFASQLSTAFAIVALVTALMAVVASFFAWNYQFNQYVRQNLRDIAAVVANAASNAYAQYDGWNFSYYNVIPQVTMSNEIRVQIIADDGRVIYDDLALRRHLQDVIVGGDRIQMLQESTEDEDVSIYDLVSPPSGTAEQVPVIVDGVRVGTVSVYALSSSGFLTQRDIALRSASMWTLVASAVAATIFASLAGYYYAQRLVDPIHKVTEAARALRRGEQTARTGLLGDDEISQLGEQFDTMADSIAADRELERRLTSDVAHELRTPLMGIQATVECIQDGIYEADAENLETIQSEVRRLTRLTNVILELSRMETGALPFHLERVDLSVPLSYAMDAHIGLFDTVGLESESYIREGLFVNGDSERLQQAIGNLLGNAARYTPEGGSVTVASYAADGFAVVEITDTGIGISDANMKNLFKRFWRADDARARATGGIGIGLAITKEIVERHRGRIDVESTEGVGTTFRILIPLA